MLGNVTFRVTPDELSVKADEVSNSISRLNGIFSSLQNIVDRTRYYWNGEAGDYSRNLFYSRRAEIDEILKRLKEHPEDLKKMAGVYQKYEKLNEQEAMKMRSDLID